MPRLLTAREDFLERTVAQVSGTLGKMRFLSRISSGSRDYEHWGLIRTFGEEAAQTAIGTAHTQIFLQELATPLRELWSELVSDAQEEGTGLQECSKMLERISDRLPMDLAGGSERHHHYIFMTLALLAKSQRSIR
jgi:hypothetical protein